MKQTIILILTLLTIFTSCNQECEKIVSQYENGKKEVVYKYPDCSDTTTYIKTYYFENGQIGSIGFIKNQVKDGLFKSWNENGVQTAEWYMKNGKEHGIIKCWFDNGVLSKESNMNEGVKNGLETIWDNDGDTILIGNYKNGTRIGKWKRFYNKKKWVIYNYVEGKYSGQTIEHLLDSTGKTIWVNGQYLDGKETGTWKWFDNDSNLFLTVSYEHGKVINQISTKYKFKLNLSPASAGE